MNIGGFASALVSGGLLRRIFTVYILAVVVLLSAGGAFGGVNLYTSQCLYQRLCDIDNDQFSRPGPV